MSFSSDFPIDRQVVASIELAKRNFRLDPSQYNERGEKILRHMRQSGIPMLRLGDSDEFNEIYLPNRFSRTYLEENLGAPMLGTSTMLLARLPVDSRIMIEDNPNNSLLWIKPGDILVSRSGTVGTSVLCGESYTDFVASDDCLRVRVGERFRGFLAAYLQSPFGQTLLTRDGHGKVIRHLKEHDICNFRYPQIDVDQMESINHIMNKSTSLIDSARKSLENAEYELRNILEIPGKEAKPNLWFNWNNKTFLESSDLSSNKRLDPHFYDPDVVKLHRIIEDLPRKNNLGEIANVWMPQRFSRPHAMEGYGVPFYSSGKVMRARRTPSAFVSHRAERYLRQCIVRSGMTLICRSGAFGGIMGHATFTSPAMNGWAISEHIIRCEVKNPEFLPEYLFAFLGSLLYGYPLITRYRHGKDVPELSPTELESLPIPKLTHDEQELIAKHVRVAFSDLDKSNKLEDEAQNRLLIALQWNES